MNLVETAQFVVIERRHEQRRHRRTGLFGRSACNEIRNGLRGAWTLELYVDHDVPGNRVENFAEGRDSLAVSRVELPEFIEREFAHQARPVRGAVHALVVNDHDSLAGHANIQLNAVDIVADGARESGKGVLGRKPRGTPVAYDQQAVHGQLVAVSEPVPEARLRVVCGNMPTS